ncbi:MAG TPA: ThuA domain-containing protein, partial [Actinophytocola sp.]|uniref:ThuA domain-containing protein n=1 Tax=Actinophytocola sp. TaxID=1872138 RepID=UPI002DDC964E
MRIRQILGIATATLVILGVNSGLPAGAVDAPYDVLVFSRTAGFRHDSIPVGIQTIRELGTANSFTVTATED